MSVTTILVTVITKVIEGYFISVYVCSCNSVTFLGENVELNIKNYFIYGNDEADFYNHFRDVDVIDAQS